MSIWKSVQDKVVLGRLEEEALYEVALDQYESGERRRGLWAKALVEAEGDPAKTQAVYLRLLVAALRDELYVAKRVYEQAPTFPRPSVIDAESDRYKAPLPEPSTVQKAAHSALAGRADYSACETLIHAAGGTVEAKGFIFGAHYLVSNGGKTLRINQFADLLAWVQQNLPLQHWSSGQS